MCRLRWTKASCGSFRSVVPVALTARLAQRRKMSTTLEYFWHLSAAGKKERLDASAQLIGALETFQAQFEPSSSKSADAPPNDQLDTRNAPDVAYAIKRLVRGLASPRESSRLGFSVALTEARRSVPAVCFTRALTHCCSCSRE